MSYGQNAPWGLQPVKTLGAATWNGQTNPYFIKSGYNQNIFKGDPVLVAGTNDAGGTQTGYLISVYDAGAGHGAALNTAAVVGIFNGCSYITPSASNPIDPASPGRQYWPAGTQTLNGVAAVAYVVDDPNVVFNVQTNFGVPAVQTNVGALANFLMPASATFIVNGNTNTGQSSVAIQDPDRATPTKPTYIMRLVVSPPNPIPSDTAPAFNNVEVLIQNHQYVQRADPRT